MKKRQRFRSFILIVSFLLFPIVQFYFSPYLMVWGASQGIITASFFTFAFLFLGSLFIGRAFCGWVMPCGALQEICSPINPGVPKDDRFRLIKFFLWVPWLLSILILVLRAGGYREVDYFFHLEHGISVNQISMYIPYYAVILLFLVLSTVFGKRASCHYICWMSPFMIVGRYLSDRLRLRALRLKSDPSACNSCRLCTKSCPMGLEVHTLASGGSIEHRDCILCGNCADICPRGVIRFAWASPSL
jgi:polyferredoxin